jgi:hypothetical protein
LYLSFGSKTTSLKHYIWVLWGKTCTKMRLKWGQMHLFTILATKSQLYYHIYVSKLFYSLRRVFGLPIYSFALLFITFTFFQTSLASILVSASSQNSRFLYFSALHLLFVNSNGVYSYCSHLYLSFGSKTTSLKHYIWVLWGKTGTKMRLKWGQMHLFTILATKSQLY